MSRKSTTMTSMITNTIMLTLLMVVTTSTFGLLQQQRQQPQQGHFVAGYVIPPQPLSPSAQRCTRLILKKYQSRNLQQQQQQFHQRQQILSHQSVLWLSTSSTSRISVQQHAKGEEKQQPKRRWRIRQREQEQEQDLEHHQRNHHPLYKQLQNKHEHNMDHLVDLSLPQAIRILRNQIMIVLTLMTTSTNTVASTNFSSPKPSILNKSSTRRVVATLLLLGLGTGYCCSAKIANAATSTVTTTKIASLSATIAGAISGGFFAGSLHAVAGPDHLAALLPRCCGQRWYNAGRVGALWGIGHGVSATILGVIAFAVKRTVVMNNTFTRPGILRSVLESASHLTELAVGMSLIFIGVMGIKEARAWKMDDLIPFNEFAAAKFVGGEKSLSAAANIGFDDSGRSTETDKGISSTVSGTGKKLTQKRAVVLNGLLHGFSWDGAPSLAPAIAVATWAGNLAFLSSYALGTMAVMALVTTLVGEGTTRASEAFNQADLPQKLSFVSSIVAIVIGAVWCSLAIR